MFQEVVIGIMTILAAGYVGRLIYQSFQSTKGCSAGCSKCQVPANPVKNS